MCRMRVLRGATLHRLRKLREISCNVIHEGPRRVSEREIQIAYRANDDSLTVHL